MSWHKNCPFQSEPHDRNTRYKVSQWLFRPWLRCSSLLEAYMSFRVYNENVVS